MKERIIIHVTFFIKMLAKEFGYSSLNQFYDFAVKSVKTLDQRGSTLFAEVPGLVVMRNTMSVVANFISAYYDDISHRWVDDAFPFMESLDNMKADDVSEDFFEKLDEGTLALMRSIMDERSN